MITIVNYGMGNLGSVQNMFKRIGVASEIVSDIAVLEKATKILLPGVGAFDAAIQKIDESGLREVLNRKATVEKIPILGICLGMQLLTNGSAEGSLPGLGWIDADTVKFDFGTGTKLKVPHMGWNLINPVKDSALVKDLPEEPRFYFVHSYHVRCKRREDVLCTTRYGLEFDSVVQRDNIFGAQFHPEKSHKFGMKLLENFSKI